MKYIKQKIKKLIKKHDLNKGNDLSKYSLITNFKRYLEQGIVIQFNQS